MNSAESLLGKVHLSRAIHYKLENNYVWAKMGRDMKWVKQIYFTENTFSPINQGFGENAVTFYKDLGMLGHNGIDWYCKENTSLFAPHDAVVGWINQPDDPNGYGGSIELLCMENGVKFRVLLGHLNAIYVKTGQTVKRDELIGLTGNTGKYTTGAHLHDGFMRMGDNDERMDINNGYLGYIDQSMLYDEYMVTGNELEKLYQYFDQIPGFIGQWVFLWDKATRELGIKSATRSQYAIYLIKRPWRKY